MGKEIVLRPVRGMRIVAVLAAGGLILSAAACGDAPEDEKDTGGSSAGKKYTACMVTDTGGIDDRSFNTSAWAGIEAAAAENKDIAKKYVASNQEADYETNLNGFVGQDCDFILAVGGLMGDATTKVATANPKQQFGIVDSKLKQTNVYPMQFNTAEAGYLAGYLAAGYSKSGKVGTYGGMKIPPVTIFMDGFADGVAYYNKTKSKNVQVLGWNKATQNGSFTNDFVKQDEGTKLTNTLVAQGADVIMPVAGGAGLGTAAAAKAANGKFAVIWVDVDGCKSAEQYCSTFLTTVEKHIADAVKEAVLTGAKGDKLSSDPGYLGTLKNDGVGLAPYHDFDSKVPAELKAEVDKLKQDIIAGTVKVESPSSPK